MCALRAQSFYPEAAYEHLNLSGAIVSRLNPTGIAISAGLRVDDCVVAINFVPVSDPLSAAKTLRESEGELQLTVERQNDAAEAVGEAMRNVGKWVNEVLTPRGSKQSVIAAMGMGFHRLLASRAKHEAATSIGSHWRGFRTRELCNTWWWAASDIQMHVRGWQTRRLIMPELRAHAAEEAAKAAEKRAQAALWEMDQALADAKRTEEEARLRFEMAEEKYKEATQEKPAGSIKRAFSFNSKKKRRPQQPAGEEAIQAIEASIDSKLRQRETGKPEEPTAEPAVEVEASSGSGALKGIKRALSFNSKKKRERKQLQAEQEAVLSDRSESSGTTSPPHKSPRQAEQDLTAAQALKQQAKPSRARAVRRTLSWTLRTRKHMAADTKQQEESALSAA